AEAAQPGIEHVGAVQAVDPVGLVAMGHDEQLGRDERALGWSARTRRRMLHGAKNKRKQCLCQQTGKLPKSGHLPRCSGQMGIAPFAAHVESWSSPSSSPLRRTADLDIDGGQCCWISFDMS